MAPADRAARSVQAAARLAAMPEFKTARTVLAFASFGTEINTQPLLEACLAQNRRLCLTRADRKRMRLSIHAVSDPGALEKSRLGFRQPKASAPEVAASELDIVLVPGVAFDPQGNRLGRGAGFYDRLLADPALKALRVGLCFDRQIVSAVPVDPHDQKVDAICTESHWIKCASPSA